MEILEQLKAFDRTRLILLIIILATIPCYCLGLVFLWNANLQNSGQIPSPTIITGTPDGSATSTYTLQAVSPTTTLTPTMTQTFTPTITYELPPTNTPSPSPTLTNSPSPTVVDTPVPTLTFTPTHTPTFTQTPSVLP